MNVGSVCSILLQSSMYLLCTHALMYLLTIYQEASPQHHTEDFDLHIDDETTVTSDELLLVASTVFQGAPSNSVKGSTDENMQSQQVHSPSSYVTTPQERLYGSRKQQTSSIASAPKSRLKEYHQVRVPFCDGADQERHNDPMDTETTSQGPLKSLTEEDGEASINHPTDKLSLGPDDKTIPQEGSEMSKEQRQSSIESYLLHATKCHDPHCKQPSCIKMKRVLTHTRECKLMLSNKWSLCKICKQFVLLCISHAKNCNEDECSVPVCNKIRKNLHDQRNQQGQKMSMMGISGQASVQKLEAGPVSGHQAVDDQSVDDKMFIQDSKTSQDDQVQSSPHSDLLKTGKNMHLETHRHMSTAGTSGKLLFIESCDIGLIRWNLFNDTTTSYDITHAYFLYILIL